MKKRKQNNGIALIMVLGLLTLMVILAVTFAVSMRTERLAAGNAADTVRARELVQVGLARAMDDLRAMFHMPDRFVVSDFILNERLVLLGADRDYEDGDEVRVFSMGNLPAALDTNTTYTVSKDSSLDRYTISLTNGGVTVDLTDLGVFQSGLNVSDSYNSGLVSGNRSYMTGTPVTILGGIYYVVPLDDTQIKLASTYMKALQGDAAQPAVSSTLELLPVHGIYPVMTIQSVDGNQLVYTASRQRLRTGMAVRIRNGVAISGIYYVRTVKNEPATSWYIQLCASYADALKNEPTGLPGEAVPTTGLIIPVSSAAPHRPAFASYGTNAVISLSDFSEQVTFNIADSTVNVTHRYRAGAAVAFTRTNASDTLPTPLNEKKAYYAIPFADNKIQLAETLDNALAVVPTPITLTSAGSGSIRIYELGLSGEATNYVPMAVYANAAEALANAASNGFFEIRTRDTDLMGKVRYAIVDCSGLLDANYVGGDSRSYGNNPREFQLGNLLDPNASQIPAERDQAPKLYKRYETLLDLYQSVRPSNTFVYSYSLPEQWETNLMSLHTPLNIGMSDNGPTEMDRLIGKYSAITNGLCMAGFTPDEAGVVFSNLIDFVDNDLIPSNFEYCVESVPMINEVMVQCAVTVTDPGGGLRNYALNGSVSIECWYPFATNADPALSFDLSVDLKFSENDGIKPNDLLAQGGTIAAPITNNARKIVTFPFSATKNGVAPASIELITEVASVSIKLPSGEVVDRLDTSIFVTNYHTGITDSNTYADIECLDPRFNSRPSEATQWKQMLNTNNSLDDVNTWTKSIVFPGADNDKDTVMYVGNRPLRSVAELGYLVYSTDWPWKTVKLYGPDRHRVLDVFAISKDANDRFAHTIYRGQINPNTRLLEVMKAWFQGMLVNTYPEQTEALGAHPLTPTEAETVAGLIVAQAGSYTNLSEIGRVFADTTKFPYPIPDTSASELERESYFRNTCGLFNVHQSVFTILLEAKVASGGNIPKNPARQRAVAIVWRDPYTGEMFVRHIKWLGD